MATVEERLSTLESELEAVKRQVAGESAPRAWLDDIAGGMDSWPEFEDVLRLGQDFRRSLADHPDANA